MKDYQNRTKDELIKELKTMYQQMTEIQTKVDMLESEIKGKPKGFILRSPREDMYADIEFIADFDIIEAKGVNISETGICFKVYEDLPFEMRFRHEGKLMTRRAIMIWAKRLPEGGYHLGLKFVQPELHPEI